MIQQLDRYRTPISLGDRVCLSQGAIVRSNVGVWEVLAMTPATVDLIHVDHAVRAQVLQRLSASGLSEQVFVGHFYRLFAQGHFSLFDLLGPNAESIQAIQELEEGRGIAFASSADLFADLHAND